MDSEARKKSNCNAKLVMPGLGALEHDPEKACPALDAGWVPVFPPDKRETFARRSCSNKKIERDDVSKKSHQSGGRSYPGP